MKRNNVKKERFLEFDILRTLACLMVIIMHAPMPTTSANGLFLSSISYLSAPCIGIFFMISGALLLPIKDSSSFLKRRFTKIFFPTLFWSLFYITVKTLKTEFVWTDLMRQVLSIPFSPQGNGVLWFMYTLSGLYLISPIISAWIERASQKEILFYLLLWIISLCYPLLDSVLILPTSNTSIIYYFSGYLGYYVLGYYLKTYPSSLQGKCIIPLTIVALLAPVLCKLFHWKVDFYSVFWYLSIFIAILCFGWFYFISKVTFMFTNTRMKNFIVKFANLSLGIYLVHIFIMRTILWNSKWILSIDSYIFQTISIIFSTVVLSFVVCLGISFLPYSEYIIGYHTKKSNKIR